MNRNITIRFSVDEDRTRIATLRHAVYATELGQYPTNDEHALVDAGPVEWVEILAEVDGELAGFLRVTPPSASRFSLDRYIDRAGWGDLDFGRAFEVRTLTVPEAYRNTYVTLALLYAAFQWAAAQGATDLVVMARTDITKIHDRLGFRSIGATVRVGAVEYTFMTVALAHVVAVMDEPTRRALREMKRRLDWRLDVPLLAKVDHSEHGGRSIGELGADLGNRAARDLVVPADVLDAWYPPAPAVVAIGSDDAAWLCRTSPPARADGMIAEIARARGVPDHSVVVGAGASDLMYRTFLRRFGRRSRVLLVRPSYGEYSYLLEDVIGARVDYLDLTEREGWRLDPERLRGLLARSYDLVVIVNPANPSGQHLPPELLGELLASAPRETLCWVDETYSEYAGAAQSLEALAAASTNLIVCKSMSKVYALSGLRVGYLVAPMAIAGELSALTPPWQVGLAGQLAAIAALRDPGYYASRWAETRSLRDGLVADLSRIRGRQEDPDGFEVTAGDGNWVLVRLPGRDSARTAVERCQRDGVYLRDLSPLSRAFRGRYVRAAVRDAAANARIVKSLESFASQSA